MIKFLIFIFSINHIVKGGKNFLVNNSFVSKNTPNEEKKLIQTITLENNQENENELPKETEFDFNKNQWQSKIPKIQGKINNLEYDPKRPTQTKKISKEIPKTKNQKLIQDNEIQTNKQKDSDYVNILRPTINNGMRPSMSKNTLIPTFNNNNQLRPTMNNGSRPTMSKNTLIPTLNDNQLRPTINNGSRPTMNSNLRPTINNGLRPSLNNNQLRPSINNQGLRPSTNSKGLGPSHFLKDNIEQNIYRDNLEDLGTANFKSESELNFFNELKKLSNPKSLFWDPKLKYSSIFEVFTNVLNLLARALFTGLPKKNIDSFFQFLSDLKELISHNEIRKKVLQNKENNYYYFFNADLYNNLLNQVIEIKNRLNNTCAKSHDKSETICYYNMGNYFYGLELMMSRIKNSRMEDKILEKINKDFRQILDKKQEIQIYTSSNEQNNIYQMPSEKVVSSNKTVVQNNLVNIFKTFKGGNNILLFISKTTQSKLLPSFLNLMNKSNVYFIKHKLSYRFNYFFFELYKAAEAFLSPSLYLSNGDKIFPHESYKFNKVKVDQFIGKLNLFIQYWENAEEEVIKRINLEEDAEDIKDIISTFETTKMSYYEKLGNKELDNLLKKKLNQIKVIHQTTNNNQQNKRKILDGKLRMHLMKEWEDIKIRSRKIHTYVPKSLLGLRVLKLIISYSNFRREHKNNPGLTMRYMRFLKYAVRMFESSEYLVIKAKRYTHQTYKYRSSEQKKFEENLEKLREYVNFINPESKARFLLDDLVSKLESCIERNAELKMINGPYFEHISRIPIDLRLQERRKRNAIQKIKNRETHPEILVTQKIRKNINKLQLSDESSESIHSTDVSLSSDSEERESEFKNLVKELAKIPEIEEDEEMELMFNGQSIEMSSDSQSAESSQSFEEIDHQKQKQEIIIEFDSEESQEEENSDEVEPLNDHYNQLGKGMAPLHPIQSVEVFSIDDLLSSLQDIALKYKNIIRVSKVTFYLSYILDEIKESFPEDIEKTDSIIQLFQVYDLFDDILPRVESNIDKGYLSIIFKITDITDILLLMQNMLSINNPEEIYLSRLKILMRNFHGYLEKLESNEIGDKLERFSLELQNIKTFTPNDFFILLESNMKIFDEKFGLSQFYRLNKKVFQILSTEITTPELPFFNEVEKYSKSLRVVLKNSISAESSSEIGYIRGSYKFKKGEIDELLAIVDELISFKSIKNENLKDSLKNLIEYPEHVVTHRKFYQEYYEFENDEEGKIKNLKKIKKQLIYNVVIVEMMNCGHCVNDIYLMLMKK